MNLFQGFPINKVYLKQVNVCQAKSQLYKSRGVESYPTSGDRKWASSVEASLPIVNWQTVTKDGHLEMLNHGVHHLPRKTKKENKSPQSIYVSKLTNSKTFWQNIVFNQFWSFLSPVDPTRTFIRFDVHLI